jgi:hypothetical protein
MSGRFWANSGGMIVEDTSTATEANNLKTLFLITFTIQFAKIQQNFSTFACLCPTGHYER